MALIKRILKCITADLHDALDRIEDPIAICKHSVREMEEEIQSLRGQEQERLDRRRSLEEQMERVNERIADTESKLRLCLFRDEVLAKAVIRKKLEQEKLMTLLSDQLSTLLRHDEGERRRRMEYEERLLAIKEKFTCLSAVQSDERESDKHHDSLSVSSEEIEIAYLAAVRGCKDSDRKEVV